MEMTFDEYVDAINALAVKAGCCKPGGEYCEAEAWRPMYDDGLTPADAWDEEVSALTDGL